MYIENLKIALDDDSATYYDIQTFYELTPDLIDSHPKPKTSYMDVPGSNGAVDLSEALGALTYNNRNLKLVLTVKSNAIAPVDTVVKSFIREYSGRVVRLRVDNEHFYRGRLVVDSDDYKKKLRQITCSIVADPLLYEIDYKTYSYDIPQAVNTWRDCTYSEAEYWGITANGFSRAMTAGEVGTLYLSLNANHIYRVYVGNKTNCTVQLIRRTATGAETEVCDKLFYVKPHENYLLKIYATNSGTVSASAFITDIMPYDIYIAGESIPIEIENTLAFKESYKGSQTVWAFINEKKFVIPAASVFTEYPQMVLEKGENRLVAYIPDSTYDPSDILGGHLLFRWREGEI